MTPPAKSFLLDLLSTLRQGVMPVRALVAAAALFGIAENNLRVALVRLTAAGLVERDERGAYRLGSKAETVRERIADWRHAEERVRPWHGRWLGVHTAGLARSDRGAARRRLRTFSLVGLRELAPGLWIRPDNLSGGAEWLRTALGSFGVQRGVPVFTLESLDHDTETRARTLWPLRQIGAGYRETIDSLRKSERRLAKMSPDAAMVESFLVGGKAIRRIVHDPLLPEPLIVAAERKAMIDAMRVYDRLGRSCWAAFLRSFDIPTTAPPTDQRAADARALSHLPAGDLA